MFCRLRSDEKLQPRIFMFFIKEIIKENISFSFEVKNLVKKNTLNRTLNSENAY